MACECHVSDSSFSITGHEPFTSLPHPDTLALDLLWKRCTRLPSFLLLISFLILDIFSRQGRVVHLRLYLQITPEGDAVLSLSSAGLGHRLFSLRE